MLALLKNRTSLNTTFSFSQARFLNHRNCNLCCRPRNATDFHITGPWHRPLILRLNHLEFGAKPHFLGLPCTGNLQPVKFMPIPTSPRPKSLLPGPKLDSSNQQEARPSNTILTADILERLSRYLLTYPFFSSNTMSSTTVTKLPYSTKTHATYRLYQQTCLSLP